MFEVENSTQLDVPMQKEYHPTTESILSNIESCVGLDIAPNHTGIAYWKYGKLKRKGFKLPEYDTSDKFAEYHMRENLKYWLLAILEGLHFEYCIIEDVYGGQNFDTVRKLLALNTVIDEIICEGRLKVDNFIRWKESEWAKYFRQIIKIHGRPNAKYETQQILAYIQDEFYMQHCGLSNSEKEKIFFEDICDASGMVYAVSMFKRAEAEKKSKTNLTMKDIKLIYINHFEDYKTVRDKRIKESTPKEITVENYNDIEGTILDLGGQYTDEVICIPYPVNKLGTWGMKKKFTFFKDGEGYLLFYVK